MAEIDLEKNGKKIFHYESKKNKDKIFYNHKDWEKYKGKKFCRHYGISKYTFNLLWTGLWFVFIMCLCYSFGTMGPLWLLAFWMMGYKW